MKRKLAALVCALAVVCTSQSFMGVLQVKAAPKETKVGTSYYFSSRGDNGNDGTTQDKPWQTLDKLDNIKLQPGDQVLLESGSVFDGFIHLKDVQGTKEAPIKISSYGKGQKPIINTNGQGIWYQNYGKKLDYVGHKEKGYVSSSVLLYDAEYVEVSGLEITNKAPERETFYNSPEVMNRTGVAAVAQNAGTVDHIVLKDLYIHDVIGNVYDKHMNNGGIYFTESQPNDASTGVAKYDDVLIENCHVENVNRWGIAVGYTYNWDQFQAAEIADDLVSTYGSTNVVIRNNYVKDAGGDAITTMYCDRPLIENNVSDGAARQINSTDYAYSVNGGKVAAAVWPWKCKDAVFQYNEVFDTCQNQDGQAWDADWGDGTVYQYNYSHNNGGGSVMFCGYQAINNVFRYNISQNDLGGVINPAGQPDAHIYNNTFYVKEGIDFIRTNMGGGPMVVENNIIYYSGAEAKAEDWFKHTNASATKYDNNLYFNYTAAPSNDENAIMADPLFKEPGTAPAKAAPAIHQRNVYKGYQLQKGSPAINAGKYIFDNGGKDFFGNEVKGMTPDIGAHQTNTPSKTASLRVYSKVYDIAAESIGNIPKGTTVKELKENLVYDERASVAVVREDGKAADSDKVTADMKLQVSYGKDTKEYTLDVVKVYEEYATKGWTAEVGSAQPGNPTEGNGNLALDGNLDTMWHTNWGGCNREDTWIAIDMKSAKEFSMLKYVPRATGTNGLITAYEIYVSNDGSNWGEAIASGTWENDNTTKYAEFDLVKARYVKLVATETQSQTALIFASAAEIRVGYEEGTPVNPDPVPEITTVFYDRTGWTATAGSEEQAGGAAEGPAALVLDGKTNTKWHTAWNGCNREDTWITIDMKEVKEISALKYLPRQDGSGDGRFNGNILSYEIYVSNDGENWEMITAGDWADQNSVTQEEQIATFASVKAQYVKLVATDTYLGGGTTIWAAAAEIELGHEEVK